MDYVLYKGHVEEAYRLLSDGGIYYVPMSMSTKKAHKLVARQERNERIRDWMVQYDWQIAYLLDR